jgi:hypothetical protein
LIVLVNIANIIYASNTKAGGAVNKILSLSLVIPLYYKRVKTRNMSVSIQLAVTVF